MHAIIQRRLKTQFDWEQVWLTPTQVPSIIKELSGIEAAAPEEAYHAATHYVAGHLQRDGFRLFRNGGLPLIERRDGAIIEEILIRMGPHGVPGAYVPISIQLHVSHHGLREIRQRYWNSAGRPPVVLASGNIGLLQTEPTWDIWNVAHADHFDELIEYIDLELTEYLELIASPPQLRKKLFDGEVPLIDHCTAIEYLLCEFGRPDAKLYLKEKILISEQVEAGFHTVFESVKAASAMAFRPGQPLRNLAVISHAYDLLRRR